MSEIRTQSRPYAEAAFETAKADDTLDAVSYTHLRAHET